MIGDAITSIKATLYDRASSPLFGAFVLAWCIWNYRVIAILFSGEDINIQFAAIDHRFALLIVPYINFELGLILHGLLIPMGIALFYIFLYPRLSIPVYERSLEDQKELRRLKQEKEDNELLSVEESREFNVMNMRKSLLKRTRK